VQRRNLRKAEKAESLPGMTKRKARAKVKAGSSLR
jgi:hypothetical protein